MTALKPVRDRFPHFADLLASEPEAEAFACALLRALAGRSETIAFSLASSD